MANAGSLIINIKSDASQAKQGFNEAQTAAKQFQSSFDGIKGTISSASGGIGVQINSVVSAFGNMKQAAMAGGVAGLALAGVDLGLKTITGAISKFAEWTSATLAEAKALKNLSGELGISAERLQAMQKLATKAGIDPEQGTKGLEKMLVLLGEFRQGSEEATKKIAKLGISANEAAGMGTMDLYGAIADKIKDTGSAAERASIAADIFGAKAGPQMVRMLSLGSKAVDDMAEKMRATGKLMTSGEMIRLNDLNSSFKQIKENFGSAFKDILTAITPALKAIAGAIAEVIRWVSKSIETFKDGLRLLGLMDSKKNEKKEGEKDFLKTATIEQQMDFFASKIAELKAKAKKGGGLLPTDEIKEMHNAMKKLADLKQQQKQAYEGQQKEKAFEDAQNLVKAAKEEAEAVGKTKEEREAIALAQKGKDTGDNRLIDMSKELTFWTEKKKQREEEKKHYEDLKQKAKEVVEASNPVAKYREQFKELQEMLQKGLITQKHFQDALSKDKEAITKNLESQAPDKYASATKADDWAEIVRMMEQEAKADWAEKQFNVLLGQLEQDKKANDELTNIRQTLQDRRQIQLTL